jgi:zinc protease
MKKLLFSIYALSLFTAVHAQKLDRSIRPTPGPAPEIKLGDAESFTLPNGMKVFVVENHKLPAVTYSIQLDIRPMPEGNKSGMHQMVGELITSGTKSRNKEKFDEEVDFISASVGASSRSIFGRSLTKYQDKMLDLMTDALFNANFQQSDLDRLKKQALSALEASKNEPDDMMNNVASVMNYGVYHPYGEVTTEATINNITLADCNNYFKQYFRPNVAYMAIVGDINLAQAKEMVNKYFAKWEKGDVPRATYPACTAPAATEVDFVQRDGAVQSVVSITYPIDLMVGSKDVLPTRVLNQVLGGSFQRLDKNLRETHAWTYGSNSSISDDDIVGNVDVNVKCRNEVTDSSITEMFKEMNALRTTPLKADELKGAVNFLSGVFALRLENPQTIAQYAINIERYNMPKDYYKNYLKNLNAVSTADVQAAANKYLKTDNAHIVVVGNRSEIPKLKKFGEVKFFDNYGRPVKPVESKVVDGLDIDMVLGKYIDAIGGKAAVEGLKDLVISGIFNQQGQKYKITQTTLSPDKTKTVVSMGDVMVQKIVINGDKGYMEAQDKKQTMPAEMVNETKHEADLQELLHPSKFGISYTLTGSEAIDGKNTFVVERVENDGKKRTVQYFEKSTGLLYKEFINDNSSGQPKIEQKVYSDYREVKNGNGYKIAYKVETLGSSTFDVESAKANGGVKESAFK